LIVSHQRADNGGCPMAFGDWFDVDAFRWTVRHTVGGMVRHTVECGAAIVCFRVLALLFRYGLPDGWLKDIIEKADWFIIVIVFGIFAWELVETLWKGRHPGGGLHSILVA
jgi:hypothetical protein